ncbi:hypothetical protein [Microbacterium sp. 10M-3C3]|uniref:hypothetical protein n=1 Tax=Microbacterium sp. 10M-3C3 TaxID=2483401 RepID=UPI000F64242E|nr:hypothetical protein [Microbacterium sp. 10M-3C3]
MTVALVWAGSRAPYVPDLDLRTVAPEAAAILDAACALTGTRWLVGGTDAAGPVVAAFVDDVLSGRAPVFGFAGVARDANEAAVLAARAAAAPVVPSSWARLIASDRVDPEVRGLLAQRAVPDDPAYTPVVVDAADLALLRELGDVLVPQHPSPPIDLAARLDAQYARGEGDGWRFAELPPDPEALRTGLATLRPLWPADPARQRSLVGRLVDAAVSGMAPFDAGELAAWLEDVRVDLVRLWLAHPASMARVGYDGFATGGVVIPLRGFDAPASRREEWEPDDVAASA